MAGNPTNIGSAPVDISLWLYIEDNAMCICDLGEITTSGVKDSLWFRSSSRGVQDKEWVLTIE
jgi:hypothetical protein